MKRIIHILLILLCIISITPVFSQTSSTVSIFEKTSVIKTEYFDIIFPQSSEQTARYVAMHADELYLKAAAFLNVDELQRIPVVVTKKTDVLNAYFTIFTYSRIVLYDTLPTTSLSVFDDTILSVFYHELIHAISYKNNLRNNIFLDYISPFLTSMVMPPSMSEGAAVLAESLNGFGRLNDSISMHVVRQAKIENKFPHWSEIAGARDLYTDGSLPYIFGGAFTEYIYSKYGDTKLAEYWKNTTVIDGLSYVGKFKKIYGLPINEAWLDFESTIEMPALMETSDDFQTENVLYQNLFATDSIIGWQDGFTGDVFTLNTDDLTKKPQFLLSTNLTGRISISRDSRFLSFSGDIGFNFAQNVTSVYDLQRRTFIKTQNGLRDATIVTIGDSSMLCGVKTDGQNSSLVFYSLDDDAPLKTLDFNFGVSVFEPIDAGEGLVVALIRNYGNWELFTYNVQTGEQRTFIFNSPDEIPSSMISLHVSGDSLLMTYALSRYTQPVLARVPISQLRNESIDMLVQSDQRSGGVFSPIYVQPNDGEESIIHISKFYEKRSLSIFPLENLKTTSLKLVEKTEQETTNAIAHFPTQNYNPFGYYLNGYLIPVLGSVNLSPIDTMFENSLSLGASYISVDPTENFLFLVGAGYDIFSKRYTATLSTVFKEKNFTLSSDGYIGVNSAGIDVGAIKLHADIFTPILSDYNVIGISNNFRWIYQKQANNFYLDGSTFDNVTSVYFSRMQKKGRSPYEILGVSLYYQFEIEKYSGVALQRSKNVLFGNIVKLEAFIPRLIPIRNPTRFTVNIPISISFTELFNYTADWEVDCNAVLFSYEIQKPIAYVHTFFKRITLDAGAQYIKYVNDMYDIYIVSSLYTTAAINTSSATGTSIDIGIATAWNPLLSGNDALELGLKFALNL